MRLPNIILKSSLVSLGVPLLAGQFDPMVAVYKANRPAAKCLAVVCDYANSRDAVNDLARVADVDRILVLDVRNFDQVGQAASYLDRVKPDAVVLLPHDRIAGDGMIGASRIIHRMAINSIPTMATTPIALKQGAWFVIGDATRGELLVNTALKGDVRVLLPGEKLAAATHASVDIVALP